MLHSTLDLVWEHLVVAAGLLQPLAGGVESFMGVMEEMGTSDMDDWQSG